MRKEVYRIIGEKAPRTRGVLVLQKPKRGNRVTNTGPRPAFEGGGDEGIFSRCKEIALAGKRQGEIGERKVSRQPSRRHRPGRVRGLRFPVSGAGLGLANKNPHEVVYLLHSQNWIISLRRRTPGRRRTDTFPKGTLGRIESMPGANSSAILALHACKRSSARLPERTPKKIRGHPAGRDTGQEGPGNHFY